MEDTPRLLSIGQLARRAGVPVRTVRYWLDEGLLGVRKRTHAGYRLYDTEALARVDLLVTLRTLGFGHDAIAAVLRGRRSLAEVACAHVKALDHQIRTLARHRSVLRVLVRRGTPQNSDNDHAKEIRLMHAIARLTATERRAIVEDLVDRAFDGIDAPHLSSLKDRMRALPPDLPDEPTEAQLDAWIELAELAGDPSFVARIREMAERANPASSFDAELHARVVEHVGAARTQGVDPSSSNAVAVLDAVLPDLDARARVALREKLETYADARVERYWELIGALNGRPPFTSMVEPYQWLIDAIRYQAG